MAEGLRAMALEGHGIAFLPYSAVKKDLRAKKLVSALPPGAAGLQITMEVRAYRERPVTLFRIIYALRDGKAPTMGEAGFSSGDMGVARDGTRKADYQPGMELHARYTFFAEGARGHLTKRMKAKYDLEANCQPQVYGIGIKELWEIPKEKHKPGLVWHSVGWPLPADTTYGGSWLYMLGENLVSIGFVVGRLRRG